MQLPDYRVRIQKLIYKFGIQQVKNDSIVYLKHFIRDTDVCVLVYDVTNYESVLSIRDWFNRFMEHCHVEFPGIVIVGNKSDKSTDRCVDLNEIKILLRQIQLLPMWVITLMIGIIH